MESFLKKSAHKHRLLTALRLTLAIIFIWFGLLKIFGFNPVFDLIYYSVMPWFSEGTGLITLGIIETFLGVMLLINKARSIIHVILIAHLAGTFSTFLYGWHVIFDPYFPVLTLAGEFVVKNLTLAFSALVVLAYETKS